MAQIAWTNEALLWLEDIFQFIAAENPDAANRTVEGAQAPGRSAQAPELIARRTVAGRSIRSSIAPSVDC